MRAWLRDSITVCQSVLVCICMYFTGFPVEKVKFGLANKHFYSVLMGCRAPTVLKIVNLSSAEMTKIQKLALLFLRFQMTGWHLNLTGREEWCSSRGQREAAGAFQVFTFHDALLRIPNSRKEATKWLPVKPVIDWAAKIDLKLQQKIRWKAGRKQMCSSLQLRHPLFSDSNITGNGESVWLAEQRASLLKKEKKRKASVNLRSSNILYAIIIHLDSILFNLKFFQGQYGQKLWHIIALEKLVRLSCWETLLLLCWRNPSLQPREVQKFEGRRGWRTIILPAE